MNGADAIRTGETAEAADNFLDAAAAYRSALTDADRLVVADAHFHLGRVAWRQDRCENAVAEYEQARALAVQAGADDLRARIENGLGVIHHTRGELAQARASFAVALELATDETQRGRVLLNLGALANVEGDYAAARTHYARSRAIFRRTGFVRGEISALSNLGILNADEGQWEEAAEAHRNALDLLESIGDRRGIATTLLGQAEVGCARERFDEVVANSDRALSLYAETGDDAERGEAFRWKGHALVRIGRYPDADRALREAIRLARRGPYAHLEAMASWDLGVSRAAQNDGDGATKALRRAEELFAEARSQSELEAVRETLAALLARTDD